MFVILYFWIGGGISTPIVTLTGETIVALYLDLCSTVRDIKTKIENETECPFDQQQLRFNGKQLDDCFLLSDYNYNFELSSELLLVMRYQG